jgi:hypothetical protein
LISQKIIIYVFYVYVIYVLIDIFINSDKQELEFHGVMRFYFQDAGQKVATKCIRVSSTATTHDVIQILIEKFRPDIRMLSVPEYALYEIHENGGTNCFIFNSFILFLLMSFSNVSQY